MELRRTGLCVLLAMSLAGATASQAGASTTSTPAAQLRSNKAAARQDATLHLREAALPSDVTRLRNVPKFARSFVDNGGPGGYAAQAEAWWTTTASPTAIIRYMQAHLPAGSTPDPGTGSGSNSRTKVTSVDDQFSWPDRTGQLLNRMLTVTVITPPHGRRVVLVQAQSSWFVPRSATELVPRAAHAVLITLRLGPAATGPVIKPGGHVKTTTYLVWRAARVRALIDEFNGLAIVQPGAEPIACPLMLTGSESSDLTLAFKRGRTGATLARLEVLVHRGKGFYDGGGACDPIDFWIGSKQQQPLVSSTFVKSVSELIGTSIS